MTDQTHNCRHDGQTESNIEKYGLTVIILEATEYLPAFAYSIGLWKTFKHPGNYFFWAYNKKFICTYQ